LVVEGVPLTVAVMVAGPLVVTLPVDAVKVAVVELAGTVIDGGTVNAALLDDKPTAVLPDRAAFDRVKVQVVLALDAKVETVHCRDERLTAAWRPILALAEAPLSVAMMLADPSVVTLPVDAVKVAVVELAGTVSDAGTVRPALLDDNPIAVSPEREAFDNVTVQVVLLLDARLAAEHCRDERLTGA
jgi:hypothetical protein